MNLFWKRTLRTASSDTVVLGEVLGNYEAEKK
jgi:hypothetical protein